MFIRSILLSLPVVLFAFGAHAADVKAGSIIVSNVWAPASAGNNAAAYATIKNDGAVADRLIDAATDAAAMAHLHVTIEDIRTHRRLHTAVAVSGAQAGHPWQMCN